MSLFNDARDRIVGAAVGAGMGAEQLQRVVEDLEQERVNLTWTREEREHNRETLTKEGLADMELSFEDVGWRDLSTYYGIWKFNRATLRRIGALSRIMYLVNPLIKRAVTVQELYVWGSGCTIRATDPKVNEVLNDFLNDPANERVIGQGEEGWIQREREQRIDGNTFFAFFRNPRTGYVRVRLIPYDLVQDVIYNPDDNKEVWFIRRSTLNLQGAAIDTDLAQTVSTNEMVPSGEDRLYPDINYDPIMKPASLGGLTIDWSVRVLHVKTGGLSSQKFGMPELYSALNWATAYKRILENFATILAAYARFAMKISGLAGKKGVAAAKSKMNTGITDQQFRDTNPPSNTAATFLQSGNVGIEPIKTSHSTTAPDEARALRSMVASGADLPEHFFGDSDVGNFATSETLDRPTELKMIARQQMWRIIILKMCQFVIQSSAFAVEGKLREEGYTGERVLDQFDGRQLRIKVTPPKDRTLDVEVSFPNITERALADRVRAVVNAATLGGHGAEGIFPERKYLFKLLLEALGVREPEKLADRYYPEEVKQGFVDPVDEQDDAHLGALAKKDLGEAAMISAKTKSTPKPAPATKKVGA